MSSIALNFTADTTIYLTLSNGLLSGEGVQVNSDLVITNAPVTLPVAFDCQTATIQDMADIIGTILTQLKGQ